MMAARQMKSICSISLFAIALLASSSLFARDVKTNLPYRPKDGMKDVRQASFLGRDKKWKEGAEFIAKLRAIPPKGRSVEERQSVDMAEFGLYMANPEKRDVAIKALKAAYNAGPSTLWGWAAWHYLGEFGVKVPKPKADPSRGLGKFGAGVVDMVPKRLAFGSKVSGKTARELLESAKYDISSLSSSSFREGSPVRRAILRTRLIEICTPAQVDRILSAKGGAALFSKLWNDDRALYDFLLSGPVFDPPAALEVLMTLYLNDAKERWSDGDMGRCATIAVAINTRSDGGKIDMDGTVRHWAAFRRIAEYGRFHDAAKKHDCREWRFVVRYPRDPADTLYFNTRRFPSRYIHNVIFNVPYRKKNCFGVSKWAKNDAFLKPWLASGWPRQYLRERIGGVCTEQSMWGALCANAHGLMAERAGQPGHCCWLLRNSKGDWRIYSYIRPYTAGVFLLWGRGFQYVVSTERAFADRRAHDESELLRFVASHAAAAQGGENREAKFLKMAALRCPYNIPAWSAYTENLKKRRVGKNEWIRYLDRLLAGAPEGRLVTWDFVQTAFDALSSLGLDKDSLAAEAVRAFKALPQPKSYIAEEMNFRRGALDRTLKRFGNRKDLKMKILAAALDTNADSPVYVTHVFSCAFDNFAKDGKARDEFAAMVAKFAGQDGNGAKIDWRGLFKKTKCLDNPASYRMMAGLRNEIDPAKDGEAPKLEDYGARLVSQNAYFTMSSSGKGDAPEDYPRVCDASPVAKDRKGLVVTKAAPGQWAQAEMPGDVVMSGVTVCGDTGPIEVLLSDDGQNWSKVADSENAADGLRIDFGSAKPQAKFVKLAAKTGGGDRAMSIKKILVYGKTLY